MQHKGMSEMFPDRVRAATAADAPQLIVLWASVFHEEDAVPGVTWQEHAREWFGGLVDDGAAACFPVIEVDGDIVAAAVGTLELGVPNPHCPRGRTARLANLITVPQHRGRGYGTALVRDVIEWARSIDADRVDLSATPDGQRIYEKIGFTLTKSPRMKLVL